jgi:hypothetical protein
MRLSTDDAIIAPEKLRDYIPSPTHSDGCAKAAYLGMLGYVQNDWKQLETDLRQQVLSCEARPGRPSPYGEKCEMVAPLTGPNGKTAWVRTIWNIVHGEAEPRFVTLIPEERP